MITLTDLLYLLFTSCRTQLFQKINKKVSDQFENTSIS